jgi:hypothetical protein
MAAKAIKPSIIVVAAEPGARSFSFLAILQSSCMLFVLLIVIEAANDAFRSKQCGTRVGNF